MDSQATLEAILGAIEDGVIATDVGGRITAFNDAAVALTAWRAADAVGQPIGDVLRAPDRARSQPSSPLPTASSRAVERSIVARDGTRRRIRQVTVPIIDASGQRQGELLVINDATARDAIDDRLLDPEKLDAVGVLAGGIAHDFNNVLAALLNNVTLAKMVSGADDPVAARLADMERIMLRAQGLTQQLLTFARGGDPTKRPVNVRELLEQAMNVALAGSETRGELVVPDEVWPVECDAGQIGHAVNAIVANAVDAMPAGGVVRVSAENVKATSDAAFQPAPGRYVRISFQDRGVGIAAEHLGKVFDPYFTTKPHHSGLGLPSVYSIMKKHEGYIDVESDVGVGSTFHLYLPAADGAKRVGDGTIVSSAPRRPLAILLMDDDEAMRQSAGNLLSRLGHTVTLARDGAEAVALYATAMTAGMPFDAVILDLTVAGGLGGREAMEQLQELDPGVRALVSSGYSNDDVVADFTNYGFSGVLPKPYRLLDLERALDRLARA